MNRVIPSLDQGPVRRVPPDLVDQPVRVVRGIWCLESSGGLGTWTSLYSSGVPVRGQGSVLLGKIFTDGVRNDGRWR